MTRLNHLYKSALVLMLANMLSACFGGSIAQQIVRSIVTSTADKVVANAMDAQERKDTLIKQSMPLKDTVPDKYWAAFVTSGFETIKPISMPLPRESDETQSAKPTQAEFLVPVTSAASVPLATPSNSIITLVSAPLVRVVLFNLLIGEEKNKVLEGARALGATELPDKSQWKNWQVATGVIEGNKKLITFLIPPEFGKMPSGAKAMVQIASLGELNVLRYASN